MIPVNEIKEKARAHRVPETTMERDYVQNWFLNGLYSENDHMIFKGGTSIRKAYIRDYRFSDDLDFTLAQEMDRNTLLGLIQNVKETIVKQAGINMENEFHLSEVKNGWKALLHCNSALTRNIRINIKLDITKHRLENICLPIERRELLHDFSDVCRTNVSAYSLEEIMAEKIRALFDRSWPRDCYDVYRLWDVVDMNVVIPVFEKKCEFKNIVPYIQNLTKGRELIEGSWNSSLNHQMSKVPEFDSVFESLLDRFKSWNIG